MERISGKTLAQSQSYKVYCMVQNSYLGGMISRDLSRNFLHTTYLAGLALGTGSLQPLL